MEGNLLRLPEPINMSNPNLNEEWKIFKQKFDFYLIASNNAKAEDVKKCALLLNLIGSNGLEIYNTFKFTDEEKDKYTALVCKFDTYFIPKKNIIFERFKFNQITQKAEQNVDGFVTELKTAVKSCEYTNEEEMIRDRLVLGVKDKGVQERLLRECNLDLKKTIDVMKAAEIAKSQVEELTEKSEVQAIKNKKFTKKEGRKYEKHTDEGRKYGKHIDEGKKMCPKCGQQHQWGKCPAFNKVCNFCGGRNHYEKVCFKKKQKKQSVNELKCNDEEENLFVYAINENKVNKDWTKVLKINGQCIKFKVDTGSQSNIIPLETVKKVKLANEIEKTETILEAYGGTTIKPYGKMTTTCSFKNSRYAMEFLVVDMNVEPILGLDSSITLNILKQVDAISQSNNKRLTMETMLEKYKNVFDNKLGKYPIEHKIRIDENIRPRRQPPRRIPIAIEEKVKSKLQELEKKGIINKEEEPTEWTSPLTIVSKPNKDIRICLDPRFLNEAIKREYFPIPTAEDIAIKLTNKKIFTVLDMKDGYLQVPLEEESMKYTSFSTPFGKYKFCRLPFGLRSAPEVFQKMNFDIFGHLQGVGIYFDDLIVGGKDEEEHDKNLEHVLQTAQRQGIKFNKNKLQFKKTSVKYMGQTFTQVGIKPDSSYVESITKLDNPKDKTELLRILGMAKFLAKFIPNMSSVTACLRHLTRKDVPWSWTSEHDQALKNLKVLITNAPTLSYFDTKKQTVIQCDASKDGLGAVLMQDDHPIAFASRSLSKTEQAYAQIEKECLAITFAVEKFHYYVFGRHDIIVQSDHKPLQTIFKKDLDKINKRLQRMILKVIGYNLKITYTPGRLLYIADLLSRANIKIENDNNSEVYNLQKYIPMSETKKTEFRKAIAEDVNLKQIVNFIKTEWPKTPKKLNLEVRHYFSLKDCISYDQGLLFLSDKIIVPTALKADMLKVIHEGHLGITKSKKRARSCLYWKNISADIEKYVKNCNVCEKHQNNQAKEELMLYPNPKRAWERISADIFTFANRDYLVIIDAFSNWIEMSTLQSKTAQEMINIMKSIFARFGIPEKVVTDNVPFNSKEFKKFADEWSFETIFTSPLHSQSNGLAEKGVNICKTLLKKAAEDKTDINVALLNYRNTPVHNLDFSPAQLLLNKSIKTKLPCTSNVLKPNLNTGLNQKVEKKRERYETYYNKNAKNLPELKIGEYVMMQHKNKWERCKVTKKCKEPRSYIIQNSEQKCFRRNRKFLKKCKNQNHSTPVYQYDTSDDINGNETEINNNQDVNVDSWSERLRERKHLKMPRRFIE